MIRENIQDNHWFWDTEVMYFCHKYNLQVCEMPITVVHQRLRPTNVRLVRDTLDSLIKQYKFKKRMKK